MARDVVISPIFYMGNKKRLISKGLIELFPKDISTFHDCFSGSGIVSMNVEAESYILSDTNPWLCRLYALFENCSSSNIVKFIESRIDEYGLARERTSHKVFLDDRVDRYKKAYNSFRDFYNKSSRKDILDFYTLMFYSFSQQFRFNNKGEFNMPCGNDCFSEKNKEYIKSGCDFFSRDNVRYYCGSYQDLDNNLTSWGKDFFYFDPPYLTTTATYNEGSGWSTKDETALYMYCEFLNSQNVKFAISNVFENRGKPNNMLIDWCREHDWNVFKFDSHSYSPCGRGNSNAKEVLITNY